MLVTKSKEITEEDYNIIINDYNGIVKDNILCKYFNQCVLCGYGVYAPRATQKDNKYYIVYNTSTSCD